MSDLLRQYIKIILESTNEDLSTDKIIKNAFEKLEPIGRGMARQVFGLPDGKRVIKIAYRSDRVTESDLGIKQNKKEVEVSQAESGTSKIVARVFKHDPEYKWIVSERVRPLDPNSSEFYEITEIPEDVFYLSLERLYDGENLSSATGQSLIDSYIEEASNEVEKLRDQEKNADSLGFSKSAISERRRQIEDNLFFDKNLKQNKKAMDFLDGVIRLIRDHGLLAPDVARTEHWGVAEDGNLKLYDYGAESQ